MLSLLDLQRGLRAALLNGDDASIAALVVEDGLPASDRLDVYRNNVVASLTSALKVTFPVVCRLVDERFFAYAAHEFIRAYPPAAPCLSEYGARFPEFLAAFPPCRELMYLADVARLEWAMCRAADAPRETPLDRGALRHIAPEAAPGLRFRLDPSYAYVASPWPIDRIWRANRLGVAATEVDLDVGGVCLEIRRPAGEVEMRALPPAVFAFRHTLAAARSLAAAAEAGLAEDAGFEVAAALAGLVADGALTDVALYQEEAP